MYKILRVLKTGDKIILSPENKKILYPHEEIINNVFPTIGSGEHKVIQTTKKDEVLRFKKRMG